MDAPDYKFIYWKISGGTGHVYFGTYNKYVIGNNKPALKFTSSVKFRRYEYFDEHSASDY